MTAALAISNVKVPHHGRFGRCKVITCKVYGTPQGEGEPLKDRVLHLEIQRDGGPYIVIRMDRDAAYAVAEQMLDLAAKLPANAGPSTTYNLPE
jgi:hypothetical protein